MALACAGAVPKLSMTVVAVTPNAMPSAPSTSCASSPTKKKSSQESSTLVAPAISFAGTTTTKDLLLLQGYPTEFEMAINLKTRQSTDCLMKSLGPISLSRPGTFPDQAYSMRLHSLRHGNQVLRRPPRSDVPFVLSQTIMPCGKGVGYERETRAGPRREAI